MFCTARFSAAGKSRDMTCRSLGACVSGSGRTPGPWIGNNPHMVSVRCARQPTAGAPKRSTGECALKSTIQGSASRALRQATGSRPSRPRPRGHRRLGRPFPPGRHPIFASHFVARQHKRHKVHGDPRASSPDRVAKASSSPSALSPQALDRANRRNREPFAALVLRSRQNPSEPVRRHRRSSARSTTSGTRRAHGASRPFVPARRWRSGARAPPLRPCASPASPVRCAARPAVFVRPPVQRHRELTL